MEDQLTILREKIGSNVIENPFARLKVKFNCKKRKFSEGEAHDFVKQAQKSKRRYRRECRVYFCDRCDSFHVTSKEEFFK